MTERSKNFWCVVALDYDKDEAWILDRSQDARDCDVLDGSSGDDNGLTSGTWIESAVPGLYRLELSPWGYQDYEGEWDTGVDVTKATLLVAFPGRLCDDEGCPHHGTDHVCMDCEVCGGDCAAANPPVINCPRDECARRGIDPDELCADGGVTAEMVVAKEIGAGCGQAVITPWQTPTPCGGRIGSSWLALDPLRNQIMRLIRGEFDPTPPNWEGRDWNDNAEDTADKILAAVKIALRSESARKELL